ncbi:MAG: hypothetical protein WAQ98_07185 [Blastocatellia bacterium]
MENVNYKINELLPNAGSITEKLSLWGIKYVRLFGKYINTFSKTPNLEIPNKLHISVHNVIDPNGGGDYIPIKELQIVLKALEDENIESIDYSCTRYYPGDEVNEIDKEKILEFMWDSERYMDLDRDPEIVIGSYFYKYGKYTILDKNIYSLLLTEKLTESDFFSLVACNIKLAYPSISDVVEGHK